MFYAFVMQYAKVKTDDNEQNIPFLAICLVKDG